MSYGSLKFLAFFLAMILASCATKGPLPERKTRECILFPNGSYQQDVKLNIKGGKSFSFKGILKKENDYIRLIGLSWFGNTVFRVEGNRASHQVTVDVYEQSLKRYQEYFTRIYSSLEPFIGAEKCIHDQEQIITPAFKNDENGQAAEPVVFSLEEVDSNQMPLKFAFENSRFKVTIKVTEYEKKE